MIIMARVILLFLLVFIYQVRSQGLSEPTCAEVADVFFALDDSGSNAETFDRMKQFVIATIQNFGGLDSKYRFGLVLFSDAEETHVVVNLDEFDGRGQDLITAIETLGHVGGERDVGAALTAINAGMTAENGLRSGSRQMVVILTTGDAEEEDDIRDQVAGLAHDFYVFPIGVGEEVTMPYLVWLAGENPDHVFITKHAKDLDKLSQPFYLTFCDCDEGTKMNEDGKCFNPPEGPICSRMADITFVFDASGSVGEDNYVKMKKFMSRVVDSFAKIGPDGVQVAAVRYASWRQTQSFINFRDYADKQALKDALMAIPYVSRGSTMTAWGLRYTRENVLTADQGMREGVPDIILVITDGRAKDRRFLPKEVAAMKGIADELLAVGIGKTINQEELEIIAGNDPDKVFLCKDFDELMNIITPFLTKVCECPEGNGLVDGRCKKCDEGSFVNKHGECTPLTTPAPDCVERIDLMFVLDASGSIGEQTFETIKNFAINIVDKLGLIDGENNQVGVVKFADLNNTREAFCLKKFQDSGEVVNAIAGLEYVPSGASFLGHGIRIAREHGFDPEHGGRLGTPHVIVAITDAKSKDSATLEEELPLIGQADLEVFAVGLGKQLLPNELMRLTGEDESRVFDASGAADLVNALQELGVAACSGTRK